VRGEELGDLVAEREAAHAHVVERDALRRQQVERLDAGGVAAADREMPISRLARRLPR
jgi:hypothetical protein